MRQLIENETRMIETTASIFDWVYTTSSFIANSGVINYNINDHLPTFLVRKKRNKVKKITVTGRSYLRYNKEAFQEQLAGHD